MKEDGWFAPKNYLHIDIPISKNKAFDLVSNPTNVTAHSFLPFITFDVVSKKYQYDEVSGGMEKKEKERNICYSSHIDSHIYSYYAMELSEKYEKILYEKDLHNNILAFRKLEKKCNIDFAYQAFKDIQEFGECAAIALDFSKFFDTLDHGILKKQWCNVLNLRSLPMDHYKVFKSLTKFSKVDKIELFKLFNISELNPKKDKRQRICSIKEFREEVRKGMYITQNKKVGIPQGSAMSGLLSNIYMIEFDKAMKDYVDSVNGKYYRYCDDMLFIVPTDKLDEVEIFAISSIKSLNVEINKKKTELRKFEYKDGKLTVEKPLQYLGFIFDGQNIYLRSASISRYYDKMKRGIKLAKKNQKLKEISFELIKNIL